MLISSRFVQDFAYENPARIRCLCTYLVHQHTGSCEYRFRDNRGPRVRVPLCGTPLHVLWSSHSWKVDCAEINNAITWVFIIFILIGILLFTKFKSPSNTNAMNHQSFFPTVILRPSVRASGLPYAHLCGSLHIRHRQWHPLHVCEVDLVVCIQ